MLSQLLRRLSGFRISLISLGGLSVLILIFYSNQTSKQFAEDAFDLLRKSKQDRIELIQTFSEKLLEQNRIEELRQILIQDSHTMPKGISGFCLQHLPTQSFPSEGNPRFTPYFICNQKCEKNAYHDYSDEFSGTDSCVNGTTLSIFQFSPKSAYISQYRLEDSLSIVKDLLLISFLIFSIILLVKLELKQAHQVLVSPLAARKKRGLPSFLRDTLILKKGLKKLNEELLQEKSRSESFSKELPGAIRKLYDRNQQTPVRFTGTLLRCDINHFSRFVQSHGEAIVFPLAKQFLIDVAHAAEIFHGYELEYAGDEVILLFKDAPHFDSKTSATFFLKEIEKIANHYHRRTSAEFQVPFRVKVSLSSGDITLDRDASGLFFSTEEFIRTVRLLKKVTAKDQNTFICSSYFAKNFSPFIRTRRLGAFNLDGYGTPHDLVEITEIRSANQIIQDPNADKSLLFYTRSIEDITATLRFLGKFSKDLLMPECTELLKTLKDLPHYSESSPEINSAGEALLLTAIAHQQFEALPHLISLIVKTVQLNDAVTIRSILLDCLLLDHPRLVADIIYHFGYLKLVIPDATLHSLKAHPSNRVQANLIIYEMNLSEQLDQIGENTLKRLNALLKSNDPAMCASGAYAFGEVGRMILDRSVASFEANSELQTAYEQCLRLLSHTDPRVRNQSIHALIKIGRENDVKAFFKDE